MTRARVLRQTRAKAIIRTKRIVAGKGRHRIYGILTTMNRGIVAIVIGGEVSHIGSIAVAVPAEPTETKKCSPAVSVHTISGHKDNLVAVPIARDIAIASNRTSTVIAGIHINSATKKDIAIVLRNSKELSRKIQRLLVPMSSQDKE